MPNEKIIPRQIPIEEIHDLPDIPIVKLADKSYGGLVTSMLLDGVKEPVILRQREDGEYQLVTGYRRRKAAELAKLKELPALVYDMTEKEAQEYHKIANTNPDAPISGKFVGKEAKTPAQEKTPSKTKADPEKKEAAAPKKETETTVSASKPEEKKAESKAEVKKAEMPKEAPVSTKTAEAPKKDAEKAPKAKAENQKEEKAAETSPAAPVVADKEKNPASPKEPAKKAEKEEAPVGAAAVGPTGTAITKLLGEKLTPPTEKDKKSLPIPGEGEAFSAILHPAYLKKADINTFSVDRDSDDFKELFQSIKRFGVKDPVLARFNKDGELEILSGQRRHLIASELNYPVPTIIQQLDDDDARILVADGNLHREHISTYDLSRALRMKADSMKRKAGRKLRGEKGGPETDELIAKEMGMSTMKLNRLMKLSEATKPICDLVDEGSLAVSIAYNIAFLQPKVQDTVADLIGINVKVNNENTGLLKKVAASESLTEQKIRDVLEGRYPPKVVDKPKPVTPPVPTTPAMAPTGIPKSPDIPVPSAASEPLKAPDNVVSFPSGNAVPTQAAVPAPSSPSAPVAFPAVPSASPAKLASEPQDRESSYETKIILRGDRLRKYFPNVSMTPREIEDSVYDALEERRQRLEKQKQKAEIFAKEKKGPVK